MSHWKHWTLLHLSRVDGHALMNAPVLPLVSTGESDRDPLLAGMMHSLTALQNLMIKSQISTSTQCLLQRSPPLVATSFNWTIFPELFQVRESPKVNVLELLENNFIWARHIYCHTSKPQHQSPKFNTERNMK